MKNNLIELEGLLQSERIGFKELDSRMSYGMIGHLYKDGNLLTLIFPACFYNRQIDISINEPFLRIIELIRIEFTELSRDNNNKICPVELGFLESIKR